MKFGSVCSGIEAASVAWHPLGWSAAWFAEIEPFPCAVLAHHYPEVPNLGDMSKLPERIKSGEIEAPDIFCGGTPCQAFSVAGLRKSLDDARGNLSLIFCEIANEIDAVRSVRGLQPATIFWENVPGVLSTKDNAFGCFLAGLAGEDDPLVAPGDKWANAGCVFGPSRTVAWRILDAQYFGVAQRRRRVFVVASARKGFDPVKVLFEFDGMRRDTAPSRQSGQEITPTIRAGAPSGGAGHGARSGDSKDELIVPVETFACGGIGAYASASASASASATLLKSGQDLGPGCETIITMAHGQGGAEIAENRSPTLTCNHEAPITVYQDVTHSLRGEGFDASEDGTGRGTQLVPVEPYTLALRGRDGVPQLEYRQDGTSNALLTPNGGRGGIGVGAIAFHPSQDPISNTDGSTHALGCGSSTGQASIAVAFAENTRAELRLEGGDGSRTGALSTGGGKPGQGVPCVATAMKVRRLTPRECERLQYFQFRVEPDYPGAWEDALGEWWSPDYTLIPGKMRKINPAKLDRDYVKYLARGGRMTFEECCTAAADGPRYKSLGNSWAVINVRWIGQRIKAELEKQLP